MPILLTRTGAGAKAGAGARVRTGAWGEEGALLKRLRTGYGLHRHDACLPVHVASVGPPGLPPLPLVPACCFPLFFFCFLRFLTIVCFKVLSLSWLELSLQFISFALFASKRCVDRFPLGFDLTLIPFSFDSMCLIAFRFTLL